MCDEVSSASAAVTDPAGHAETLSNCSSVN